MALRRTTRDREFDKFTTDDNGLTAIRTTATMSGDIDVSSSSVDTSGYIGKASGSNGDFTTTYASATTLTVSSLPNNVTSINDAELT